MQPDKESKPKKPGRREPSCSRVPSARIRGVVASPYQEGTRRVLLSRRTVREPSSPSVSRDDQGPPRVLSRQTAEEPSRPSVLPDDHRAVIPTNLFATFETTRASEDAYRTTTTRERDSREGEAVFGLDSGIETTALHAANFSAAALGVVSASLPSVDSTDESFESTGLVTGQVALESLREVVEVPEEPAGGASRSTSEESIWSYEETQEFVVLNPLPVEADEGSTASDEETQVVIELNLVPGEADETMAARPNRKFERPPIFSGLPTEDVIDWAEQYSLVGDYNAWSCKDKHDNLFMYLKGSAQKWFKALTPKTMTWLDVTTVVANTNVVTQGVRALLLESFKIGNYKQYNATKLQNRQQEAAESAVDYFYDLIALCAVVDPQMPEEEKVSHLVRGLGHEVSRNLYLHLNDVKKSADFLALVRMEEEGRALYSAKKGGKASLPIAGLMTTKQPHSATQESHSKGGEPRKESDQRRDDSPRRHERAGHHREVDSELEDLRRQRRELDDQIRQQEKDVRGSTARVSSGDKNPLGKWGKGRDSEGRIICFRCSKVGHMGRDCPTDGDDVLPSDSDGS